MSSVSESATSTTTTAARKRPCRARVVTPLAASRIGEFKLFAESESAGARPKRNAVATATEAKVQAVLDAGFAGTGTATDAICVAAPLASEREEEFTGPRSVWGARIARAVHAAVLAGAAGYAATLNGRTP